MQVYRYDVHIASGRISSQCVRRKPSPSAKRLQAFTILNSVQVTPGLMWLQLKVVTPLGPSLGNALFVDPKLLRVIPVADPAILSLSAQSISVLKDDVRKRGYSGSSFQNRVRPILTLTDHVRLYGERFPGETVHAAINGNNYFYWENHVMVRDGVLVQPPGLCVSGAFPVLGVVQGSHAFVDYLRVEQNRVGGFASGCAVSSSLQALAGVPYLIKGEERIRDQLHLVADDWRVMFKFPKTETPDGEGEFSVPKDFNLTQALARYDSSHPGIEKNPYTAGGVTSNGQIVMLGIDGRQLPYSVGVTPHELVEVLYRLGIEDGLYFSGGGDLSVYVRGMQRKKLVDVLGELRVLPGPPGLVNVPCNPKAWREVGVERPIPNALLFVK